MRQRRIVRWIIFVAAVLTLPLCCLSAVTTTITLVPIPMFRAHFVVSNQTGETLYLTPIGQTNWKQEQKQDILDQYYRSPNLPVWQRLDLRMEPGDTRYIIQMFDEDYTLDSLVVRNEQHDYRQLVIEEPPALLVAGDSSPPTTYTINSFSRLPEIEPDLLALVNTAARYNYRRWIELASLMGVGLIPLGLGLGGFFYTRQQLH